MRIVNLFFLLLTISVFGCYYDNEAELYPDSQNCDTTAVTYSLTVSPIIQQHCLPCHSNGVSSGGITLEGYEDVKVHAESGRLSGVINHSSGFSPMPQDAPKLSDCDIEIIENWIGNGVLNN